MARKMMGRKLERQFWTIDHIRYVELEERDDEERSPGYRRDVQCNLMSA
jgi:hypothetical protein